MPLSLTSFANGGAAISTSPATKLIIATTKSKYATGTRAATTNDSSVTRMLAQVGPTGMTEFRLEVNNWWFLANATEEQINSGTLTVEAVMTELLSGRQIRFLFGGANIGTVPTTPGAARLTSDALLPSAFGYSIFAPYSKWLVVARRTAATSSDQLPWSGTNQSLTSELEYEYQYSSATSNAAAIAAAYLDNPPALSLYSKDASNVVIGQTTGPGRPNATSSGISVAGGFVILGRANGPAIAACLEGDSISDGTNDTQSPQPTTMGNGWFGRALVASTGLPLAGSIKNTMSGDRAQYRIGTATSAAKSGGNTGNGTLLLNGTGMVSGRVPGVYQVRFTTPTAFTVTSPTGSTVGSGTNGVLFSNQLSFTITAGGIPFVAGDGFDITIAGCALSRNAKSQCTHYLFALGVNDIAGGQSLAQLQASTTILVNDAKLLGAARTIFVCVTPKTTSTDGFITTANQTPAAGFEVGGIRDQFNAWGKAGGGGLFNGFIDFSSGIEEAGTNKWLAPGGVPYTADGTHPLPVAVVSMAGLARAVISSFSPVIV